MKILCVTPWFPSDREDKEGNYILDSIESLVDLGHELFVLVTHSWRPTFFGLFSQNWVRKTIDRKQFPKFYLETCHYFSVPRTYFCSISNWSYKKKVTSVIEKLHTEFQFDLLHAHTELSGMAVVGLGKKLKLPTVVTLHGISMEPKLYVGSARKNYYQEGLNNADRIVVVGKTLIPFFKMFMQKIDHFRVIPNGFRFNNQKVINSKIKEKVKFISVSNLVEGKGVELNLEALAKLKNSGITNWNYKIVGDGDQNKKLRHLTQKLGLSNYIEFVGSCNHKEVFNHLSGANVFILPSYREAFGIAYLEAMALGLLTIGIKGQGPETFIDNGKTGWLVPAKDSLSLFELFKDIFLYPNKMQGIADKGQKHVLLNFTWKNHASKLTHIFNELTE